jgi:hypothetical protein
VSDQQLRVGQTLLHPLVRGELLAVGDADAAELHVLAGRVLVDLLEEAEAARHVGVDLQGPPDVLDRGPRISAVRDERPQRVEHRVGTGMRDEEVGPRLALSITHWHHMSLIAPSPCEGCSITSVPPAAVRA